MRLSERKSAPPWSAEMMLTRSRYLLAVGLRPSMPGSKLVAVGHPALIGEAGAIGQLPGGTRTRPA